MRDDSGWGRNLGGYSLLEADICFGIFLFFIYFLFLNIQVIGLKLEGSFLSLLGGVWLCRKDRKLGEGQVEIKVNPQQ